MYPVLDIRMQARITPQIVLASQVLRASAGEVEEIVRQAVDENPALELVRSMQDWASGGSSSFGMSLASRDSAINWEGLEERLVALPTAIDQLVAQAAMLVKHEDLQVAVLLIHSLDEHGYLREPLPEIASRTGAGVADLERVLCLLQQLEPPGVGARNLRECLLIQCAHLQAEDVDCTLPRRILEEAWEDFTDRRFSRVARQTGVSLAEVKAAAGFITRNLYPYPLRLSPEPFYNEDAPTLPDFVIHRQERDGSESYWLQIPGEEIYELRLNDQFDRFLHWKGTGSAVGSPASPQDRDWARSHAELARQFMAALERRWGTLRRIGEFLISHQADFLANGPRYLKPITRAAVAKALGLHESTVSRAISDKIVQLPDGRLRPLDDLFDSSLPAKDAVQRVLLAACGPMSDREIAECLQAEGLEVARRTIAKYRGQMSIPNHRNRLAAQV